MNETKTKQSVTQQKSNWKPWQIVLVILLGLCALPVVVPVGLGLLAAAVGIAVALGACVLGLLACSAACGIGMILVLAALLLGGLFFIGTGIVSMFHAVGSGFAILGSGFMMTGSAILGTALLIGLVWLIWKGILWIRARLAERKSRQRGRPEPGSARRTDDGTSAAERTATDFTCWRERRRTAMKNKILKKTLRSRQVWAAAASVLALGLRWEEARCFIWITKEFI
ncbi:MAG: hypothetical protein ACLURV_06255 [Gallintestinimicrobium sp.]